VLVHDGPDQREYPDFDLTAQALASRGYAVFQPNFRGSGGDPALLAAGAGQWGSGMQTDLSDGVARLAAHNTDSARAAATMPPTARVPRARIEAAGRAQELVSRATALRSLRSDGRP